MYMRKCVRSNLHQLARAVASAPPHRRAAAVDLLVSREVSRALSSGCAGVCGPVVCSLSGGFVYFLF